MDRNIPHVLDIFTHSPGAKRRVHAAELDQVTLNLKDIKVEQKSGSDSAVSVGSSDEDEDERNISRYFDYLNDDDTNEQARRKKKKKTGKENIKEDDKLKKKEDGKNKKNEENERTSRKTDYEKEMKHIERHLSMKKTIRKKIMRDLQQAFVENPGEFQQDPNRIPPEKKKNIDLQNLTLSKKRLSKSEHNFLDMLKDEPNKEKDRRNQRHAKSSDFKQKKKNHSQDELRDDDSGNGSPTREGGKTKQGINKEVKEEKKPSFWKRLTGKGKNKR